MFHDHIWFLTWIDMEKTHVPRISKVLNTATPLLGRSPFLLCLKGTISCSFPGLNSQNDSSKTDSIRGCLASNIKPNSSAETSHPPPLIPSQHSSLLPLFLMISVGFLLNHLKHNCLPHINEHRSQPDHKSFWSRSFSFVSFAKVEICFSLLPFFLGFLSNLST